MHFLLSEIKRRYNMALWHNAVVQIINKHEEKIHKNEIDSLLLNGWHDNTFTKTVYETNGILFTYRPVFYAMVIESFNYEFLWTIKR